jgi:site-specific recombinase XerD
MYTFQSAIYDFLKYCQFEKNLSLKTIKSHRIDFNQLTNFLIAMNYSTKITEATKFELRKFLESISSLKPKSIKRKVATINAMFNYLGFEDKITINPFSKMRIRIKELGPSG